jgi:flagellar biosynthesis chaperone FliJ
MKKTNILIVRSLANELSKMRNVGDTYTDIIRRIMKERNELEKECIRLRNEK